MTELDMGALIAARRKALNLTQKQLAEQLNVTDKAVSKWERGQGYPDITLLAALADALGIPVRELLQGAGEASAADTAAFVPGTPPSSDGPGSSAQTTSKRKVPRRAARITFTEAAKVILSAACLVAILVCFIVDLATSGGITWSVVPLAGVLFGWLVLMPFLQFGRHRFVWSMLAVTLFILPLLYVVHTYTGGGWLLPVALPSAALGVVSLWAILLVSIYTRLNLWYKLAFVFIIVGALDFILDLVLAAAHIQPSFTTEGIVSLVVALLCAAFSAILGGVVARRRARAAAAKAALEPGEAG